MNDETAKHSRRKALRTLAAGGALAAVPMALQARPQLSERALRLLESFEQLDEGRKTTTEEVIRLFLKAQRGEVRLYPPHPYAPPADA